MKKAPKSKILFYIMTENPCAKVFWRVYFWYQLREAKKRRLQRIKDGRGPLI